MRIPRLLRTSIVRFAASYTIVFCISAALLLGFIYNATVRAIDAEIDTALETEMAILIEVSSRSGLEALIDLVRERSADPTRADNAYLLVDAALQPVAGNLAQWPVSGTRRSGPLYFEVQRQEEGVLFSRLYRALTVTLPGSGQLLVAHDVHRRVGIQQLISKALAWGLAATLALGVVGGMLSGRALLRRLGTIADTSARIMDGNLADRIPVSGQSDELDRLAVQLNRMLERIEHLVEGMRSVSDNVAHDLRAPLTRLYGGIETALLGQPELSSYRSALEQALFETDRVLRAFNAVMSVAQARSGVLRSQMRPLDLIEVVADAVDLYEPSIEERGLVLDLAFPPGPAPILGHRQLLAQAVVNLLDNAVKFTPSGGVLRVSVTRSDSEAGVCVADTGPGIPRELRQRVLAPFVRGNDCDGVPGSGLGLSLVAAVAQLHQASLVLEDNAPGLRVTLSMRLASGPPRGFPTRRGSVGDSRGFTAQ
ncbi:HAMP domain-containing histidine kinase [Candidimonas sp. SYP-B2681]|uniref:sensor histidine kinase n=1 Tax=Candidimonas sp. SYP-B2681 TaxID=2497686 RepID=UPI000F87367E|nr:HAMP domain-containing sensor histidine kinase [Candidimonas sp. SYP-B2681]RTZ48020.1 HAMP domain-containing histidine kinase [Candidimonas sp. SYP-B2681]